MGTAAEYLDRAAEFRAKADAEANPKIRAQYETLSLFYGRLAEQAEQNSRTDIVYEPPLELPPPQPQQQQSQPQQQQQQQQQAEGSKPEPDGKD